MSTPTEQTRLHRTRYAPRNLAHVAAVREKTFCAICGEQPIEWHNPDHEIRPNSRVSALAAQGVSIARIDVEIAVSTPLCRRCHMETDGRMSAFVSNGRAAQQLAARKHCAECGSATRPFRRGLCGRCNDRRRWQSRRESVNARKRAAKQERLSAVRA